MLCNYYHNLVPKFFHHPNGTPTPLGNHFLPRLPQPLAFTNLLSVSGFACCGHFLQMESYTMWPFAAGYFPQHNVFKVQSYFVGGLALDSSLWLNDMPLSTWTLNHQTRSPFPSSMHTFCSGQCGWGASQVGVSEPWLLLAADAAGAIVKLQLHPEFQRI